MGSINQDCCRVCGSEMEMGSAEEEGVRLGEFRVKFKASRRLGEYGSLGDDPKMRRSLSSEGVRE